jgi:hypothetical protein
MANTTNLGLYKPNRVDEVEVDVSLAQNFEILDTEIGLVQDSVTATNTTVAALDAKTTSLDQTVQSSQTSISNIHVRLDDAEQDIEDLIANGGGGTPGIIDGGGFLDVYKNLATALDGGEF